MCTPMSVISGSLQQQNVGLDVSNVIDWTNRSRREKKPPSLSYWQQFVETDDWYLKKLLEDVPDDEVYAACFDEEDLHLDAESDNEDEDEDDVSGSGSEDQEFVPEADSDDDEISSESTELIKQISQKIIINQYIFINSIKFLPNLFK